MSKVELSQSGDWELEHDSQDVRGWDVVDGNGSRVGTVRELVIDTDQERVTSLVLDSGQQVPARSVLLGDGVVHLDGISVDGTASRSTTTGLAMTSGTTGAGAVATSERGEARLPIIEEELRIGKRMVEKGGVRVGTRVEETPIEESVELREERVTVERRATDRPVTDADIEALDGGTIEVTEKAEEAVVEKRARVVEEVVVRKDVENHTETIRDSVRRTDVDVEKLGPTDAGMRGPVDPTRGPLDPTR